MSSSISKLSRVLEALFFYSENLILKKELDRLQHEKETADALSKVSGIENTSILKELVERNIRPETLAAFCLVPIIEVAWADGSIASEERKAVLDGAAKHGFGEDHAILNEWLKTKPEPSLLNAWEKYMDGLCEVVSKTTLKELHKDVLDHARIVAEASGGFLGLIDSVSPSEKAVLSKIEEFFKKSSPCEQKLS
ncbi:MAG: hypothetical protein ACM31E_02965 [Fibrobacterota bacterium]|nr:hypothetical protein [Chitinispirillaceae bacterium]